MDVDAALASYDAQLRRDARAMPPARIDRTGHVVRYLGDRQDSWEAVLWTDIDEATADAEIARQIAFFLARGKGFEWKHHAYDRPVDLPARLVAAGLQPEDDEALMVAETAAVRTDAMLPAGVRLVPVVDTAGVDDVMQVHREVFGTESPWLRHEMISRLESGRDNVQQSGAAVVAVAADRPVCAARVEFHQGTEFASLWGGGTLPEWRGRGIYRALLGYRARLAAARGYRYLQVDASPDSRPILERLGFVRLTTTTPYVWRPSGPG